MHPSDRWQFWRTAGRSSQAAAAWNLLRPVPGGSWAASTQALPLQPLAAKTPRLWRVQVGINLICVIMRGCLGRWVWRLFYVAISVLITNVITL